MNRAVSVLTLILLSSSRAGAEPAQPVLQVFVRAEGAVPDWIELDLEVEKLRAAGTDPVTGRRFDVVLFEGSQRVSIPRSAEGSARLLVSAPARSGRLDRILITLGPSTVLVESAQGGQPRVVPLQVADNALQLSPSRPLVLGAGGTTSLLAPITFGRNAILTQAGVLAIRSTLAADTFVPQPENYLQGAEQLRPGLIEDLPELGVRVARAKAYDPIAGTVRNVSVETKEGALVSFTELRSRNEDLWRTRLGALSAPLVRQLASLSSTDPVLADVWIDAPGPSTLITSVTTSAEWDLAHAAFVQERRAAAAPLVAQVAAALAGAGATVLSTELHPPVVHIQARRSVIEGPVARAAGVVEVLGTPTQRFVQASQAGVDLVQPALYELLPPFVPLGMRIALVEHGACVLTTHEAFQDGALRFEEPLDPCTAQGPGAHGGHSTAVAGALASYVPPSGGSNTTRPPTGPDGAIVGAPGSFIFTADACSVGERIRARNPHLVNLSCFSVAGGPETDGWVEMDHAVYVDRIFVARGSGNLREAPLVGDLSETAFCVTYNGLCVGGYSHAGTPGPDHFRDDLTPTGGWRNYAPLNREKPDLVGPSGARLPFFDHIGSVPVNHAWSQRDGTSFATPFVVGTASLVMNIFQDQLLGEPTLLRAVLMASANHSFPGFPRVPSFTDGIDDPAGAGAPRGDRAREIMERRTYHRALVDRDADFDAAGRYKTPISFEADMADRVRIVFTYDQCQTKVTSVPDRLLADIDLIVNETNSSLVVQTHANNSLVDNTEILDFVAGEFFPGPRGRQRYVVTLQVQHWDPWGSTSRTSC